MYNVLMKINKFLFPLLFSIVFFQPSVSYSSVPVYITADTFDNICKKVNCNPELSNFYKKNYYNKQFQKTIYSQPCSEKLNSNEKHPNNNCEKQELQMPSFDVVNKVDLQEVSNTFLAHVRNDFSRGIEGPHPLSSCLLEDYSQHLGIYRNLLGQRS